jgi:hypothetical protein
MQKPKLSLEIKAALRLTFLKDLSLKVGTF